MYTVWHVDKYKITFKLAINWTNEILQHVAVSSSLSRAGIIDARARYRAAARRLRNTAIDHAKTACRVTEIADQVISSSQLFRYGPFATAHVKILYEINTSRMSIGITRFFVGVMTI